MLWRVDVLVKKSFVSSSRRLLQSFAEMGLNSFSSIETSQIYLLDAEWGRTDAERVASDVLIDRVVNDFRIYETAKEKPDEPGSTMCVVIFRKPGVMDPVEASVKRAVADIGLSVANVRIGRKYLFHGTADQELLRKAALRLLANDVIDDVRVGEFTMATIQIGSPYRFALTEIPVLSADDAALMELNERMTLSLNARELKSIKEYFGALGRNPTDLELETIAQTWSEHCKHKTFTGTILFGSETIENLLKSTVMRATKELNLPWCVSVFKDNAGVIEFDDRFNVCIKVETHNHPSAIEPYGGASTGVGGVLRDCLGCGLGAKPIANTDVFCVGLPDAAAETLPKGTIHPRRLLSEVVRGVRDYGNRMGVPTVNGGVFVDERYTANPLVYCGTVGILPKEKTEKRARAGDCIVVAGGRTGRDGIHGATFSSTKLTSESEVVSSGAVQIGNAITEKKLLDAILVARDRGLYTCITDCGAGGLSSAVGEMGEHLGAEVDLENVPLKYDGLTYAEIWISESQERMVLAVPPEHLPAIMEVFALEDVEAGVIGKFTGEKKLHVRYKGTTVGMVEMEFLHDGLPRYTRRASWSPMVVRKPAIKTESNFGHILKDILRSWNCSSREWIIRQYDHEVQGGSVIKPLAGRMNDGPSDAAVVRPLLGSFRGVAIGNGLNPRYGDIDPYHMAASAIDEALRNVVAVGGNPERTALVDNFCWGNPDDPATLGALVRASKACYDLAVGYGLPFISGKDSLHNVYHVDGRTISIPHTLLISSLSIVDDVRKCVTMEAKGVDDPVYVVGLTKRELGGSEYYALFGESGGNVPTVDIAKGKKVFAAIHRAIREGTVRACHDCSQGGIAAALAEMAFAGEIGMDIELAGVPVALDVEGDADLLFSESNSRFVVAIRAAHRDRFERALGDVPFGCVGKTTTKRRLSVKGKGGEIVISEDVAALKEAWRAWTKSNEFTP